MGRKPIVSVTLDSERISIKKLRKLSLPYLKCVLRLSCVGRFMAVTWVFM